MRIKYENDYGNWIMNKIVVYEKDINNIIDWKNFYEEHKNSYPSYSVIKVYLDKTEKIINLAQIHNIYSSAPYIIGRPLSLCERIYKYIEDILLNTAINNKIISCIEKAILENMDEVMKTVNEYIDMYNNMEDDEWRKRFYNKHKDITNCEMIRDNIYNTLTASDIIFIIIMSFNNIVYFLGENKNIISGKWNGNTHIDYVNEEDIKKLIHNNLFIFIK